MADARGWRRGGLATTALGAVLVLLSFTVLDWYDAHALGARLTFGALRADLGALRRPGYSQQYFDWLVWLVLVVAVALAVLASRPSRSRRLQVAAAAFGVAASAATYLALWSFFAFARNSGATGVGVFHHAAIGVYLVLAGFLLIGAGAFVPSVER